MDCWLCSCSISGVTSNCVAYISTVSVTGSVTGSVAGSATGSVAGSVAGSATGSVAGLRGLRFFRVLRCLSCSKNILFFSLFDSFKFAINSVFSSLVIQRFASFTHLVPLEQRLRVVFFNGVSGWSIYSLYTSRFYLDSSKTKSFVIIHFHRFKYLYYQL